ncbi:MAG: PPC domain-containing protein, partial [Chitinophagales bacterium]
MKVKSTLISVMLMLFCWSVSFADTEPDNNTAAGADPIALNGSVSGTAGAINDNSDWYVFTTNADGNITFTITNDGAYTYLYLFDSDGATLIVTQTGYPGAGGITLQANGLAAGTYYIQVYNIDGVSNYTLTNTLTPDPLANDNEPNDVYTQAKTLPLNGDKTGHIDYRYNGNVYDNNDWYKVTTTSDGNLSVTMTNDPGNYIYLYLYDIDGTTLLANTSGYPGAGGITMTRTGLSAGVYYVLVYGINGYSGYTLSDVFTPDPRANDEEPNDNYTTANVIPVNDSTQGHIDYFRNGNTYDNHDWYSITTTNDGTIDLNLTNTPGNYVYLYLVDNDGTTIINSTSGYPGSSGIHMTTVGLAAGTYYIDVLGQDGYSGYTLTNSLTTDGISNDVEPNNTPATALPIAENSTVTGHIDYRFNGGTHDNNDYYQLTTTTDGSITVTLTNSTGT